MTVGAASWIARLGEGRDLHLYRRAGVVLVCGGCGCLFTPMDDGVAIYPDRYACIGSDPDGSSRHDDAHCACHDLPYEIPNKEKNP